MRMAEGTGLLSKEDGKVDVANYKIFHQCRAKTCNVRIGKLLRYYVTGEENEKDALMPANKIYIVEKRLY